MHMKLTATLVAILVLALTLLPQAIRAEEEFMLLSHDEAKQLQLEDEEWELGAKPKTLGFGIGPKIVFEVPTVEQTEKGMLISSPSEMNLLVLFKDGISPVDMASLDIKAKKGWFSKNLTKRLKPYLHGNTIKAENVKIPAGRFKLEIKIADQKGNESIQEYLCQIGDK